MENKVSHALRFNTLAFVKKLEFSGIKNNQAKAIAEGISYIFEDNFFCVSTRQDLILTENALKKEIEKLSSEFDSKSLKLKKELIMWIIGILFTQTILIFSMFEFFIH